MLHKYTIPIVTDSSGDAVVYSLRSVTGRIVALKYAPGDIDTGAGLVVTGETSEVAVLTKASAGTSDVWYYPLALSNKVSDGAASAITEVPVYLFSERLKVVVASGGATKTGAISIVVDE